MSRPAAASAPARPLRVLITTQHYAPEITACAYRWQALASGMAALGAEVTVLTCFPNYPAGRIAAGWHNSARSVEEPSGDNGGVRIVRVWTLPAGDEGALRRALSHSAFMLAGRYALTGSEQFDVVVGTSPPLGAAELGAQLAAQRQSPFVMEVRDLWPDVIFDTGYSRLRAIAPLLYHWERSLYRRSAHLVTVTPSFIPLLAAKGLRAEQISIVPPGIDCQAIAQGGALAQSRARELRTELKLEGKYVALYLGNHGASQGLDVLIESAPLLAPDIALLFVGDGWEKPRLMQRAAELSSVNLHFLPPLPRAEVAGLYALADACLVTLRGSEFMQHFLPSKLVEVLAYGKPVLSNIGGEGARLIRELQAGEVLPDYTPPAVAAVLNRWAAQGGPASFDAQSVGAYMQREYDSQVLAARYLSLLQGLRR